MLGEEDGKESEHLHRNIFMVNQRTASWEPTYSSQDFHCQSNASGESSLQDHHGQSIVSDEISSVGAESFQLEQSHFSYEIENNWESSSYKTKRDKHACSETQWLP